MEARTGFVRATRRIAASLGEITSEGYVFRTDLRLRPDASVTPVCISMAAAERYYEAEGRNWERAAYIKARAAAGDIAAGERFLKTLTPFVWRKHLDFAAIRDTQDMRQRIRDHKGLHGFTLEGHNMKLGQAAFVRSNFLPRPANWWRVAEIPICGCGARLMLWPPWLRNHGLIQKSQKA